MVKFQKGDILIYLDFFNYYILASFPHFFKIYEEDSISIIKLYKSDSP